MAGPCFMLHGLTVSHLPAGADPSVFTPAADPEKSVPGSKLLIHNIFGLDLTRPSQAAIMDKCRDAGVMPVCDEYVTRNS